MSSSQPVVHAQSFLTLHYRLFGESGDVVNTFDAQPATLSLGQGELAPELEALLVGLSEGEQRRFDLPAGRVFGERNPDLLQWVSRDALAQWGDVDASYEVGDVVQFPTPDGEASYAGVVRECQPQRILFDFNHPLAGRSVCFEVQIIGVL